VIFLVIPIHSKIADEIQYLYGKILLRPAREFEIENYLKNLEDGQLQLSDIKESIQNSSERQHIDLLKKVGEGPIKTMDGINMYLDPTDFAVSGFLCAHKTWEAFETLLFKKFIEKNTIFIDIGAHIGYYSLLCASKSNEGKIISFEPFTRNFNIFKKNILLNHFKNIKPIKKAVLNKNNSSFLYISNENNTGDNRFFSKDLIGISTPRKNISVACIKLDDYLHESNLKPDVIKMDIQGAEFLALQGMIDTLQHTEHLVLFTEFWPKGIESTGESPSEFLNLLEKFDLKIYDIDSEEKTLQKKNSNQLIKQYLKKDNPELQTNLLCLKNLEPLILE